MDDLLRIYRLETWLLEDGGIRRPTSREVLSLGSFLEQQRPGVDYTVYKRMKETYSDSLGGLSPWQKVKLTTLSSRSARS